MDTHFGLRVKLSHATSFSRGSFEIPTWPTFAARILQLERFGSPHKTRLLFLHRHSVAPRPLVLRARQRPPRCGAGVAVRRADRRTGALPAVLSGREGAKKLGLRLSSPFSNHSGPHRSVKHVDSLLGVFWYAHAFPQECQEVKREIGSPVHPIFNVMSLFSHLQSSSFPLSSVRANNLPISLFSR